MEIMFLQNTKWLYGESADILFYNLFDVKPAEISEVLKVDVMFDNFIYVTVFWSNSFF